MIGRGALFTIGGHEFRWSESPIATATLHEGDGKELDTVHVSFDPEMQEPDDAMLEDAKRYFLDLEHMRSLVKRDAIDALVSDMHKAGTGESGSPLAETMVSIVAKILTGDLKLTVTDDDARVGLTPDPGLRHSTPWAIS